MNSKNLREFLRSVSNVDGNKNEDIISFSAYSKPKDWTDAELRDLINLKINGLCVNYESLKTGMDLEREFTFKFKFDANRVEEIKRVYFHKKPIENAEIQWRTCDIFYHDSKDVLLRRNTFWKNAEMTESDFISRNYEFKLLSAKFKSVAKLDTGESCKLTWKKSYEIQIFDSLFQDIQYLFPKKIVRKSIIQYIVLGAHKLRISIYDENPGVIFVECEDETVLLKDLLRSMRQKFPLLLNSDMECKIKSRLLTPNPYIDFTRNLNEDDEIDLLPIEFNSEDYLMLRNINAKIQLVKSPNVKELAIDPATEEEDDNLDDEDSEEEPTTQQDELDDFL